jgi:hypothetical protein
MMDIYLLKLIENHLEENTRGGDYVLTLIQEKNKKYQISKL